MSASGYHSFSISVDHMGCESIYAATTEIVSQLQSEVEDVQFVIGEENPR